MRQNKHAQDEAIVLCYKSCTLRYRHPPNPAQRCPPASKTENMLTYSIILTMRALKLEPSQAYTMLCALEKPGCAKTNTPRTRLSCYATGAARSATTRQPQASYARGHPPNPAQRCPPASKTENMLTYSKSHTGLHHALRTRNTRMRQDKHAQHQASVLCYRSCTLRYHRQPQARAVTQDQSCHPPSKTEHMLTYNTASSRPKHLTQPATWEAPQPTARSQIDLICASPILWLDMRHSVAITSLHASKRTWQSLRWL